MNSILKKIFSRECTYCYLCFWHHFGSYWWKYSFSLSRTKPQITQAEKQRDKSLNELKKVNKLIERYNEKSAILDAQFNIYEMVLRNNNLIFEEEAKKINLKPLKIDEINRGLGKWKNI